MQNGQRCMVSHELSNPSPLNCSHHPYSRLGDVIYLRILGRPVIVLNSAQAATDLLEKRGENYSDRPDIPIFDL